MVQGFIVVMFDIPNEDKYKRIYRLLIKSLKQEGYHMIQKSIYYKQIRNIRLSFMNIKSLKKHLNDNCNVKAIILTQNQFEKIIVVSGEPIAIERDSVKTI